MVLWADRLWGAGWALDRCFGIVAKPTNGPKQRGNFQTHKHRRPNKSDHHNVHAAKNRQAHTDMHTVPPQPLSPSR